MDGANHDALASGLAQHLCDSLTIAHERATLRPCLENEDTSLFSMLKPDRAPTFNIHQFNCYNGCTRTSGDSAPLAMNARNRFSAWTT